jgi:GntR family transcriptional regulator/MocR family aminotransferase
VTRTALGLARVTPVPVRVDAEGLDVASAVATTPDAAFAVVTPGQQAPLGVALSPVRRRALLGWAARSGAWIIEDDYLSELQLKGRAAPALAASDQAGRVVHIGSFSKTISPSLRLGFIVAPPALVARFGDAAACLAPAPGAIVQHAVAEFIRDGHHLRHLRRMKRLYAARRDTLKDCLGTEASVEAMAGLAVLLRLPDGTPDKEIAAQARAFDLAPGALSLWHTDPNSRRAGLLLGVTNLGDRRLAAACAQLETLIRAVR